MAQLDIPIDTLPEGDAMGYEAPIGGLTAELPTTIDEVGLDKSGGDIAMVTIYLNTAHPLREERIQKVKVCIERPHNMPLEEWNTVIQPDNGTPALRPVSITTRITAIRNNHGLNIGDIGFTPDHRITACDPKTFHFASAPDA